MSLFKVYGIVAGGISIFVGVALLISKRLDSNLSDKETRPDQIKPKRILWGIVFIIGGLLSLSAVLLGWPPIRGYIVPPP